MKKVLIAILCAIVLTACGPSETELQAMLASTIAAMPTQTAYPTYTIAPTYTPQPTFTRAPLPTAKIKVVTATPLPTANAAEVDQLKQELTEATVALLGALPEVVQVNLVRWNGEDFEVEVKLAYSSEQNHVPAHFSTVQMIAIFFSGDENRFKNIFTDQTRLVFTSYPDLGSEKYISESSLETLQKLDGKQISFDEWKTLSNFTIR